MIKPKQLRDGMRYGKGPWKGSNIEISVDRRFIVRAVLRDKNGRTLRVWEAAGAGDAALDSTR